MLSTKWIIVVRLFLFGQLSAFMLDLAVLLSWLVVLYLFFFFYCNLFYYANKEIIVHLNVKSSPCVCGIMGCFDRPSSLMVFWPPPARANMGIYLATVEGYQYFSSSQNIVKIRFVALHILVGIFSFCHLAWNGLTTSKTGDFFLGGGVFETESALVLLAMII